MKPQNFTIKIVALALLVTATLKCAAATRWILVECTPPDAEVYVGGESVRPNETNRIKFDVSLKATAQKKNYFSQEQTADLRALGSSSKSNPYKFHFSLARNRLEAPVEIKASVDGANIYTNKHLIGSAPWKGLLVFDRADPASPWQSIEIGVTRQDYKPFSKSISGDEAESLERTGLQVSAQLDEIRREVPIRIDANTPGAKVYINDTPIGTTPLETSQSFTRADGSQAWSTATLRIAKDGYEFAPLGKEPIPEYVQTLTVDSTAAGLISARDFTPVKFVSALLRTFEITNDSLMVRYSRALSAVDGTEQNLVATFVQHVKPQDGLVVSRISGWQEHADRIVYAKPSRDPRSEAGVKETLTGCQICINDAGVETPITSGDSFDTDPFVTADGKFIYFSSNRNGQRALWRVQSDGTLPQPLTGQFTHLDTEPVVSADGKRLAYTSQALHASPGSPSTIYVAEADGTLAAPIQPGHSPSWSPNGDHIAYVGTDDKIWVMDPNGRHATQITAGDESQHDAYPIWTPSGNHIIFASDRGLNKRNKHYWGIWIISRSGQQIRPLTLNGSYDACPAVSFDGQHIYLYFFSNRGAQKAGEESVQIFRAELPPD